ncbi:MAG: hypothetical protein L0Z73_06615 [Gammaproteobacteria bacterium]|nr:hypothetical protein [Gammaproteobacteria bacterium]
MIELTRITHPSIPCQDKRIALETGIIHISYTYPRIGYRKIHTLLTRTGWNASRETDHLIHMRERLPVLKKTAETATVRQSTTQTQKPQHPNHVWSYHFVFDQITYDRTLKHLTVVDKFTRARLMI